MEFPDFFKLKGEWCDFFYDHEMQELIEKISNELPTNRKGNIPPFYPSQENIFRCFYETPYEEVNVVLLGQDPYHNGSATGLCFDVKKGNVINPSLQNIYKELKAEGFYPTEDGCLTSWAKQGVLLLNTALTVVPGDPESHLELWIPFTEKIFKKLSEKEGIIWILLGQKAASWKSSIPQSHTILEATHPMPLSATRNSGSQSAFLGSGIFKAANNILYKSGKDKIVW